MNIFKKIVLIILLSPLAILMAAQNKDPLADSINYRLLRQLVLFPQEKIYTQIDKPYYIAGETIWMRAHLVEAMSHTPDTTSRYVYAELISPMDSMITRIKIRQEKGAYGGYIDLPEDIAEGQYELRCYTRFMQNIDQNYFFKRQIMIGDPLSALYRTQASFAYENDDKKKIEVSLHFTDVKTGNAILPEKLTIKDERNKTKNVKLDKDSVARFSVNTGKQKVFYLEYDYLGKFHKQFIPVNVPDNDFHVDFFPEGGNLVAQASNVIAFKALNTNGLGEDIEGIILNEIGDTIGPIKSEHKGMGYFLINHLSGEKLYAICRNDKGLEKKFELPPIQPQALALHTVWQSKKLMVEIRRPADMQLPSPLYLLVHSRGRPLAVVPWEHNRNMLSLESLSMPAGVVHLMLIDSLLNPISERLVFNYNKEDIGNLTFSTNKTSYKNREKVKGLLSLTDVDGNPSFARLSMSVTDDKDVQPDTCVNILTSMLLTSDLRGYIESPADYFTDTNNATNRKLDILMMTQGWRRYNIPEALKGNPQMPLVSIETSQEVSGVAKGGLLMNKAGENFPITLIAQNYPLFGQTFTTKGGKFTFRNFEIPDSVRLIVQAQNKKGSARVDLVIDEELFPNITAQLPLSPYIGFDAFADYMEKADQKFVLDNGMRMIYLKDIEVTAQKVERKNRSPFSSDFNTFVSHKEFEKYNPTDIYSILMRIPGVRVEGKKVYIRGNQGQPLLLIDGIPYEMEDLDMVTVHDVDEIEVVKDGGAAVFGMRGGNGAIMITTKRGEIGGPRKSFNIKALNPLGYQVAKEFYSPRYETRQQIEDTTPDLRTTIYWNPNVAVDEKGNANIDFYTADAPSTYSVVIEGVTSTGQVVRTVGKVNK